VERGASLTSNDRRDLFQESANRRGVHPAIIEKDFWVCWVLARLFRSEQFRGRVLFKGAGLPFPRFSA